MVSHSVEMESVGFLELLDLVLASLLPVQSQDNEHDENTRGRKSDCALQNQFARSYKELHLPSVRVIDWVWNYHQLRIRDDLGILAIFSPNLESKRNKR